MPNCHVKRFLTQAYLCLLQDIEYAYPALGRELSRDRVRLSSAIENRGIPLFLVDFPAIGKHLDRCLDDGEYRACGLPLTQRRSSSVVIPKFLGGLYLLVFERTGLLKEDYDVEAVFFLRQFYNMAKKVALTCPDEAIHREVDEFIKVDEALPDPSSFWKDWDPDSQVPNQRFQDCLDFQPPRTMDGTGMSTFLETLDIVSGILTSTLGPYKVQEWRFRHGPGAIADVSGPANKFAWFGWSARLDSAYPISDCGYHNWQAWAGGVCDIEWRPLRAARLIAVPKTFTKPRLIAAEPSEHQWCQQNLWHYFCERVGHTWISKFVAFRDQTRNQSLCQNASSHGRLITIDLKAASDRVTPSAVACLFRSNPELIRCLAACRTQFVEQRIFPGGKSLIELRKFSTMGSSVTFPVQSLLFLAIALSSVIHTRGLAPTTRTIEQLDGEVSVFGDDIIVPTDCREAMFNGLALLGFVVNTSKTFTGKHFRESCGVDAFGGVDVTPAYLRTVKLSGAEHLVSMVETHNNFYKKWLMNVSAFLARTVGSKVATVPSRSAVVGLHSRVFDHRVLKTRYNEALHRYEALVPSIKSKVSKTKTNDDSAIHQFLTERPLPTTKWEHGYSQRPSCRMTRRWVDLGQIAD